MEFLYSLALYSSKLVVTVALILFGLITLLMAVKGLKSAKKDKPSRAERGYSDARGPKKKDDWQEFFKDKEPDFSEEGWARRKPKK